MRAILSFVGLLSLIMVPSATRGVPLVTGQSIVIAGDEATGLAAQTFTLAYGHPNDSGEVAISGRASSGRGGVWLWNTGSPASVLPVLLPGPSLTNPGLEVANAFVRNQAASGKVGIQATYSTGVGGVTTSTDTFFGIYDPAAGYTGVVREGDPIPGAPTRKFILDLGADAIPQFNAAGQAIFTAGFLAGGTFEGGLWKLDPALGLAPLTSATGFPPIVPNIYDLNDAGDVVYATPLPGAGQFGIYGPDAGGAFYEVARTGGLAPGLAGFGAYTWIPGGGDFSLNELGQVGFAAELLVGLGSVTVNDNWGLWVADGPGNILLRHREGDLVPGAPAGIRFREFDTPVLNDAGALAFSAQLRLGEGGVTNLSDSAIFGPDGLGGVRMLAREGDPVPGIPGSAWGNLFDVHLSQAGEVAFAALNGGEYGIFLADLAGVVRRIVGAGDDVDLGDRGVRSIESVVEWQASPDLQHYAVTARFSDGDYGLFLVSIPEPGTGTLVVLGLSFLAMRRPQRVQR